MLQAEILQGYFDLFPRLWKIGGRAVWLLPVLVLLIAGGHPGDPKPVATPVVRHCRASWYSPRKSHVRLWNTPMLVAHRSLRPGTVIEVVANGRKVRLIVAGWGPAKWTGRDLDIGRAGMAKLFPGRGIYPSRGVATVRWRVLRRVRYGTIP